MRILIVGGVAGGASAAARARRLSETAEIILFERGEHISFANCGLPYHIGGTITDRDRLLVQTPKAMKRRFNIDVRVNTEIVDIDSAAKTVTAKSTLTGDMVKEEYDYLILSPGADPVRPPLPGIDSKRVLTLRNLADMDRIKAIVDSRSTKRALVIGGGYIGLEMAEALRERKIGVMLVELSSQVMAPADEEMAAYLHQELSLNGVDLRLGTSVKAFRDEENGVSAELSTGESQSFDLVILAIGVKPETALAKSAGLTLGPRGGIAVNKNMRTSNDSIYAVGDAVEVTDFVTKTPALIPLAGPANRQGRIAANNIFGQKSEYNETQGTAVCKVFGLTIAMTGTNEKILQRLNNKSYDKVYVHPANHASYYPGATTLSMKLIFDPEGGKLLGAQAVGHEGVDKRIDVLAVAIRAGLTVFDLEELELCYAPPYGSAKDPVNYLGFIAGNIMRGTARQCHVAEILKPGAKQVILDVRTQEETESGMIPGAVNIPVDALRSKLDSLDKAKEYLVYCKVGLRGYLACRILTQNGFVCKNLSGGYSTYQAVAGLLNPPETAELHDDTGERGSSKPSGRQESKICINACGLQCPGPIMRLKTEITQLEPGAALEIAATDPGFASDVKGWCQSTGNELVSVKHENGQYVAQIIKRGSGSAAAVSTDRDLSKKKTIVVFSNDFDRAMAAFIIANGAAAMGSEVTLFFTFWGLNILRKDAPVTVKKTLMEKMFGMMMPRGPRKLKLSQMNMAGMGSAMIRKIMKDKNVASLPELIKAAQESGVKLVACAMSMDLMGIKKEELIAGVENGGVAMYLQKAEEGNVNLFI